MTILNFSTNIKVIMKGELINRAYLETLSFSDLSNLADEYGLDVPENLDRRFLIAELLEIAEESDNFEDEMIISSETELESKNLLPKNYNETQISGVLRNPAWLFVFWNISESDQQLIKSLPDCSLKLRICSMESPKEQVPVEAFEIQIGTDTQEQYVLLPKGQNYIKVELVYVTASTGKVLAFSPIISIPQGSILVNDLQPGMESEYSEILQLSGLGKVVTDQYKNHRHSFS